MEANKKVSIVIPVYKAADTITRCVESLENNTYKNLQIILVEDCSGDQTIGVCRKLADMYDNVLCVENDQNHGDSPSWGKGGFCDKENQFCVEFFLRWRMGTT